MLAGLMLAGLGMTACGDEAAEPREVVIEFSAVLGGEPARCGGTYAAMGVGTDEVELMDLRLYLSNVRLTPAAGEAAKVSLEPDGLWQAEDVALLDFEDASAGCAENGTTETNARVVGSVPPGSYDGLAFDLAVPFGQNHGDLAAAPSPLNVSSMFWTWSSGHKFARIDLGTGGNRRWNFHLGSTQCTSGGVMSPPTEECARPNRAEVSLAGFNPDTDRVVLDLAALFADSDLGADTLDSPPGCQSDPLDGSECGPLFPNVGLDFASGVCIAGCSGQRLFTIESLE
jgi:uncharacterized repeat protein (TIGR04052 family)